MKKVKIHKVLKETPGGFHSWVKSNVGIIRKPNNQIKIKQNIFLRIWNWLRSLFKKIK
jgi:hypothetical protein